MTDSSKRDSITDAIMRFFLPNSYGEPARGAPNPFTPPLWRDQRNPDDPLFRGMGPPPSVDPYLARPVIPPDLLPGGLGMGGLAAQDQYGARQ